MRPHQLSEMIRQLNLIGMKEGDFDVYKLTTLKKYPELNDEDLLWNLLQESLSGVPKPEPVNDQYYQTLRNIYFLQWQFLKKQGKDASAMLKKMLYCDLMKSNLYRFKMQVTFMTTGCCSECDKYNELTMPLEEAIANQPIPFKNCIREQGCNCTYGFMGIRDSQDRLIYK